MFVLNPGTRLDLIQPPPAVSKALKAIHSDEHAVVYQRPLKDRGNGRIGNQRFGTLDGLRVIAKFRVDQNTAGPQEPCLDAHLDAHTLDGARKRLLLRFGIVDAHPEFFRALKPTHVPGLRQRGSLPIQVMRVLGCGILC